MMVYARAGQLLIHDSSTKADLPPFFYIIFSLRDQLTLLSLIRHNLGNRS